jgi:hypothetical protein
MIIERRIRLAIAKRKDDVFVRPDFSRFGSEAQVSRAFRSLLVGGVIVKLGVGVYAKGKRSVISGKPIPVKPVSVLAPLALRKMGVTVYPSQMTREYNSGATTQLPAGNVLNTGTRRISRKLSFGSQVIEYENNNRIASRAY